MKLFPALKSRNRQLFSEKRKYWCIDFTDCTPSTLESNFNYRSFGAGNCSVSSFDDFLHMWRVIGYYLGVEDRFNPVRSSLNETKALLWEIGNEMIIPAVLGNNCIYTLFIKRLV